MAIRNIVKEGDPILNKVCRPVTTFDDRLATLLDDMHETMIAADGVGLAGPQVGMLRRLFVVQHDFAVRRPLRIENAVSFVHILLRYCWSWLPLSESVKVKVVRPFSLVTAICSLCWSKMVLTM